MPGCAAIATINSLTNWSKHLKISTTTPLNGVSLIIHSSIHTAEGFHDLPQMAKALDCTHEYIADMGAKHAAHKSRCITNDVGLADWTNCYRWCHVGEVVKVGSTLLTLGAHVSLCSNAKLSKLTIGIIEATAMVLHVRRLPVCHGTKAKIIRLKCFPKGLYGCGTRHADDEAMRAFQAAILATTAPYSAQRSANWTFITAAWGDDLHPVFQVILRRAVAMRRLVAKRPHLMNQIQEV